jgi:hypothetical protein
VATTANAANKEFLIWAAPMMAGTRRSWPQYLGKKPRKPQKSSAVR